MDVRQVLLDARVAEAAEAWLSDPQDVGVYARLVAAIEERRHHLRRTAGGVLSNRSAGGPGSTANRGQAQERADGAEARDDDGRPQDAELGEAAEGVFHDRLSVDVDPDVPGEPAAERSWPTVRSVGADLAGDPAAVLRRLRGG